jgi:hypothetical protein
MLRNTNISKLKLNQQLETHSRKRETGKQLPNNYLGFS